MTWVLVVDDDDDIRWCVRMALEDAGYEVAEAADGLAALEILRATPRRMVVLLDLMMPRMDGATLLEAVAADSFLLPRHAFVVLTAAYEMFSQRTARLLDLLAAPTLPKPFDLDDMLKLVEDAEQRVSVLAAAGASAHNQLVAS